MDWLWIPVVALLGVFLLALCCYFFSDYGCCCFLHCCRRKRRTESELPTIYDSSITPPLISRPSVSPVVHLHHGTKPLNSVMFNQRGMPTLDLHGMTVLEARRSCQVFLHKHRMQGSPSIQVITGRGIHSANQQPKVKPAIRNVLIAEGVQFCEVSNGGAYVVSF